MRDVLTIEGHDATGREKIARAAAGRLGWPLRPIDGAAGPCVIEGDGIVAIAGGDEANGARWTFRLEGAIAPVTAPSPSWAEAAAVAIPPPGTVTIDVTGMEEAAVGAMIAALVRADVDRDSTAEAGA